MDEKQKYNEEKAQIWKSGCFLGLVLAVAAVLILSVHDDKNVLLDFMKWFPLILPGYLVIGVGIIWCYTNPAGGRRKRKAGEYLRGIVVVNVSFVVLFLVMMASGFLPEVVRLPVAADLIVLIVLWLTDYLTTVRLCSALNGKDWKRKRVMIYDLDECPKTREDFFEEIEKYCQKNQLELEYVEKNNPAIVKLDGTPHLVLVEHSYHRFGPLYSLKFEELNDEKEV